MSHFTINLRRCQRRDNTCHIRKDKNTKCEGSNIFIKLFELVETRGAPLRNMKKTVIITQQSMNSNHGYGQPVKFNLKLTD
jgi:hypothetical protein